MPDEPDETGPLPWERQPGENAKQFAAFVAYRDMPTFERSIRRVAQDLGKTATHIAEWSKRHEWVRRVGDYDVDMDRLKREKHVQAIEDMAERHASLALTLQAKALEAMQHVDVERLKPADLARFLSAGVEIERTARGQAGTKVAVEHGGEVNLRDRSTATERTRRLAMDPVARGLALQLLARVHGGDGEPGGDTGAPGDPGVEREMVSG